MRAISQQGGQEPAPLTPISVEVKPPPVTHNLTLRQIRQWIESNATSPKDKLAKERLKDRLDDWAELLHLIFAGSGRGARKEP